MFGSCVPVGSGLIAFLAVQGIGVPEGCLGWAHADLPSRTVIIALLGGRVINLIGLAVDIELAFL